MRLCPCPNREGNNFETENQPPIYKVSYPLELGLLSALIYGMFIKRASKRITLHCHEKVSFCWISMSSGWVVPVILKNSLKPENYLNGLIFLAPRVFFFSKLVLKCLVVGIIKKHKPVTIYQRPVQDQSVFTHAGTEQPSCPTTVLTSVINHVDHGRTGLKILKGRRMIPVDSRVQIPRLLTDSNKNCPNFGRIRQKFTRLFKLKLFCGGQPPMPSRLVRL